MEIDWRDLVNDLDGPFPEEGAGPPAMEMFPKKGYNPEDIGQFSKLTTEIYFFVDKNTNKTYTYEKHWITEFGETSIKEAKQAIKKG